MNITLLSMIDVATMLGVPDYKIKYIHNIGAVPRPASVSGVWVYSPDDVARLRAYFQETLKNGDGRTKRHSVSGVARQSGIRTNRGERATVPTAQSDI
jgi:hypothetical protein